jgi:amino acid transporter
VVSFTHRPLYSQETSPWYLLDRRLGGSRNRSGRGGEKKNSQPLIIIIIIIIIIIVLSFLLHFLPFVALVRPFTVSTLVSLCFLLC